MKGREGDPSSERIRSCDNGAGIGLKLFFQESYDPPRQYIKMQRHYFANKGLSTQSYGFSSSHVWMWELDYKESWASKNWCFWTVVLEKTLESPLDCKEIKPVNPKGNQPWIFIERTDAEAENPILWPPDVKNWLIRKDQDVGKDWRREEKGTTEDQMVGWNHWLNGHEFEQAPGDGEGLEAWCAAIHGSQSQTQLSDWTTTNGDIAIGFPVDFWVDIDSREGNDRRCVGDSRLFEDNSIYMGVMVF